MSNLTDLWWVRTIRDHLYEHEAWTYPFDEPICPTEAGNVHYFGSIDECQTTAGQTLRMETYDDDGNHYHTCLVHLPLHTEETDFALDHLINYFGHGWGVTELRFPSAPELDVS